MRMVKLSVIIPLYNKEKYIAATITSVLHQSFVDFEIVVINDGSTDNSRQIVKGISDTRIRLIDKQNEGVSATRNRGVLEAKGEYVMFLDADDVLLPNAFSEFERMAQESKGCDVLVASFMEKDESGNTVKKCICENGIMMYPMRSYWKKDFFPRMGNTFIKRSAIRRIGPMRTDFTLYEDMEWIIRLIRICSVFSSDKIILEYRRCRGGLSFKTPSIDRDFAGVASMADVQDGYERLIIGDFLMRRTLRRLLHGDLSGMMTILKRNWKHIHTMIWAFICRRKYK